MKYLFNILATIGIITVLSSCNNTDDVHRIFTKGTKKMTMMLISGSSSPREENFWNGDSEAKRKSLELRDLEENYRIVFDGEPENGEARGTFTGRAVKSTFEGTWWADGQTNQMSMLLRNVSGNESDILAQKFIDALRAGVFKYQGNDVSLSLFYKEGTKESNKFIGFITVERKK